MGWQDLESQIVEEWRKTVGQGKLQAEVRQSLHVHKLPKGAQVLRDQIAVALHQRDRVEHILARQRGAVMPDCILPQVHRVARAIRRNLPTCRQVPHGQSARIKLDQTAENEPVNIPIGLVKAIQRGVEAHDVTHQRFSEAAASDRVGRALHHR